MIVFIVTILKTTIVSCLINYYLKKNYPEKYNDFLIALSYNTIYMGSVIQIKIKKTIAYIYKKFPRLKEIFDNYNKIDDKQDNIEYILNGKVIYLTTKEKIVSHIINIIKEDLIIYSDYDNQNSENIYINKKIIITDKICRDEDFIYEVSDIKFMLCELVVGEKLFKIDLKNDNHNYYLVDNIINKKFIIYYLVEFYNEAFYTSTDKFILKIIDHNVNICEIDITDSSNYIQIKKDNYIII